MQNPVDPGIHPNIDKSDFEKDEWEIINRLGKEWYVTTGSKINLSPTSAYRYILIKPISIFKEMFDLEREIALVFSPYENFEPRTLDAISVVIKKFQTLRIERICAVVVSKDIDIEQKITNLLKNDQEAQIVIPFSYDELLTSIANPFFFRNRFKKHFYTRDLFSSEAPLKKDLYFFGRTDIVHSLVNRHRTHQVSGLFGLRKTGKTSVIFGVQRALDRIGAKSAFIDCQNPAFHRTRWNKALFYVLREIKQQNNLKIRLKPEDNYTEEKAPLLFEECIVKMSEELGNKNILIIFDEIENITYSVSPSEHWATRLDFVYFFQTLRSLFQKLDKVFSYLIVGTNPLCVELERIEKKDNPIFGQIPLEYINRFDVPQTREMVRRLGRIMGLQFDEILYSKITEDFGGHPYLIRHVCSVINKFSPPDRPVKIDKSLYEKSKRVFLREYSHFLDMILNVLKDYFKEEYEMLSMLARGDCESFCEFAALSPLYTNHLIGYGILEENRDSYSFRIETIQEHLEKRDKYKKLSQSPEERRAEISERRNNLEIKLRSMCRMQLMSHLGVANAKAAVLKILGEPRATKNSNLDYNSLFDGNKSGIFFSDLQKIISKHWLCFQHVLGPDKNEIINCLNVVNKLRVDAHAKNISTEDMQYFRVSANKIEDIVKDFFM